MRHVIFGAGNIGEVRYRSHAGEIAAVIDNSPEKQGGSFHGLPIISLETYRREEAYRAFPTRRSSDLPIGLSQSSSPHTIGPKLSGSFRKTASIITSSPRKFTRM